MQYIAESLFFVLDHSLPLGVPLTPKGTESRSTGTFSRVTSLAPALAGMFLDVLLSHSTNASEDLHRIQWTFWELAKVENVFMIVSASMELRQQSPNPMPAGFNTHRTVQ